MSGHHEAHVNEEPKSLVGRSIGGLILGGIIAGGYFFIMMWLLL